MIKLVYTKSNEYWLVEESNRFLGMIVGNAVRLTKKPGDDYYFIHNVQLMSEASVSEIKEPGENEKLFFDYVRRMGEIPGRKFITDDFGVSHYLIKE